MQFPLLTQTTEQARILSESAMSDRDFDELNDPKNIVGLHADHYDLHTSAMKKLDRNNKYHNIIAHRILSGN
jgi:hypothetical protein